MTPPDLGVDAGSPEGLWLPLTEIARMRNVSKQAIAKRVARLHEANLIEVRDGPRGTRLVNVAAFDKAAGEHVDAVRALNGAGLDQVEAPAANNPKLSHEQARRAGYAADLAKLELDERLGKLVPVADVEKAMIRCAEALVRGIDQLPGRADDLAAEMARHGAAGARTFLKQIAVELRKTLEREMRLLADTAADD